MGIAVLLYGLFIGIVYLLAPIVAPGHGHSMFSALGLALMGGCAAGLFWLQRRPR